MNLKRGEKETGKIKEEREKKINEIKTYLCTNMKKEKKLNWKEEQLKKTVVPELGIQCHLSNVPVVRFDYSFLFSCF